MEVSMRPRLDSGWGNLPRPTLEHRPEIARGASPATESRSTTMDPTPGTSLEVRKRSHKRGVKSSLKTKKGDAASMSLSHGEGAHSKVHKHEKKSQKQGDQMVSGTKLQLLSTLAPHKVWDPFGPGKSTTPSPLTPNIREIGKST